MRRPGQKLVIGIALPAALAGAVAVWVWKCRQSPAQGPAAPATARAQAPPAVPEALKPLTDTARPWQGRVDLLRQALKSRCGEEERVYLYHLLETGARRGGAPEDWYVVANDIMEQLRLRDPDATRFCTRLLALLDDAKQPPVLRDYAVQHLAAWLDPRANNFRAGSTARGGRLRSRETDAAVLAGLAAAATRPELQGTTIPGTACMVLVDLSRVPDGPDWHAALATLKPWVAAALAEDSRLAVALRVSAVQAAALAPEEFRPALRALACREHGEAALRLPAIAALARCGDASDLERLRDIAAGNPDLAFAAADARRVLGSRLDAAGSQDPPDPVRR
jgi:hypothetical protein